MHDSPYDFQEEVNAWFAREVGRDISIRSAQLLQGIEPLHTALEVAKVSLRSELPCVGTK